MYLYAIGSINEFGWLQHIKPRFDVKWADKILTNEGNYDTVC